MDLLASTFPLDQVNINIDEINREWDDLVALYPEFETPCFTCPFFDECKTGAKYNPIACTLLLEWFLKHEREKEAERAVPKHGENGGLDISKRKR